MFTWVICLSWPQVCPKGQDISGLFDMGLGFFCGIAVSELWPLGAKTDKDRTQVSSASEGETHPGAVSLLKLCVNCLVGSDFAISWTIVRQGPPSTEFSRQEY